MTWTRYLAGVVAGAALICGSHPVVAQDKGKAAAAQLAQAAQTALTQLYSTVPLAKALGPKAHAILAVQQQCRQVRSRTAAESW